MREEHKSPAQVSRWSARSHRKGEVQDTTDRAGTREGTRRGWGHQQQPMTMNHQPFLFLAIPAGLLGSTDQHVRRSLHGPCCPLPGGKIPLGGWNRRKSRCWRAVKSCSLFPLKMCLGKLARWAEGMDLSWQGPARPGNIFERISNGSPFLQAEAALSKQSPWLGERGSRAQGEERKLPLRQQEPCYRDHADRGVWEERDQTSTPSSTSWLEKSRGPGMHTHKIVQ